MPNAGSINESVISVTNVGGDSFSVAVSMLSLIHILLVHQGVAITTVQKLLGHTSVKTTQIYSEVLSSTIVRDLKNVQRKKVKMFPDKGLRTSDFIDNR